MAWLPLLEVSDILAHNHYLGPISRGVAWQDEFGILVFANPSSRRLPHRSWLELVRWCILSKETNAGSQQWAAVTRALREKFPDITTVVSYSDPSVGHTGALYRACNWKWAPTWHRLRPPPTGNGNWGQPEIQPVKDRWVFTVKKDGDRQELLRVRDDSIMKRMPWASYQEPHGGDYKRWKQLAEVKK